MQCFAGFCSKDGLVKYFAENEGSSIASIHFRDLTGDGLDEIIVTLHGMEIIPFFIFTASRNDLRMLYSFSHMDSSTSNYRDEFFFSGTCDSNLQAVIRSNYTDMEDRFDLSYFISEIYQHGENTSFEDGKFEFIFLFPGGLEFLDIGKGMYELKCNGEVRLLYTGREAYINEAIALSYVYLSYDVQNDMLVVTKTDVILKCRILL